MGSITITGASTLAKDEVERMVQDAEKLEQIETKNQAENVCYQLKKQLSENQVAEEQKQKIEGLVSDLETALQNENFAEMKTLVEQATANMQQASQNPAEASNSGNEDVIETDFSSEK